MKKKLLPVIFSIFLSFNVIPGLSPFVFAEDEWYPDTEMEMIDLGDPDGQSSEGGTPGENKNGTNAKTSDANNSLIWWVLAGFAACGIVAGVIIYSKKRSRKE